MHEAVLKNPLHNFGFTIRQCHQAHELGLQVCRKARIDFRYHINGAYGACCTFHCHAITRHIHPCTRSPQNGKSSVNRFRHQACQRDRAPCHGGGNGEGSGFDPVRQNTMICPAQLFHTCDANGICPRPFDPGAHGRQACSKIPHFGFPGRVLKHGFTFGERCRHHECMGCAD